MHGCVCAMGGRLHGMGDDGPEWRALRYWWDDLLRVEPGWLGASADLKHSPAYRPRLHALA